MDQPRQDDVDGELEMWINSTANCA